MRSNSLVRPTRIISTPTRTKSSGLRRNGLLLQFSSSAAAQADGDSVAGEVESREAQDDEVQGSSRKSNADPIRKQPVKPLKKIVFSGIQPTGIPHLGNYLGALQQWKTLQDERAAPDGPKVDHKLHFCIVDLHSLTTHQPPDERKRLIKESYASLLAIGLDPRHSIVFVQSHVPYHAELMWYLSTIASTGYLSRMTQWKSKLGLPDHASLNNAQVKEQLKLGLFSYPVLQAADVLLYRADTVPVGEDQAQHIEFARILARGFNSRFQHGGNPILTVPRVMISPAKRIMSLKNPSLKMSKSHQDPRSRILITDSKDEIHSKLRTALTDSISGISYDPGTRPGVSNLIDILKATTDSKLSCEEIAAEHSDMSLGAFKSMVADAVCVRLEGIRERYDELVNGSSADLVENMYSGAKRAKGVAGHTMKRVRNALGLMDLHHLREDSLPNPAPTAQN